MFTGTLGTQNALKAAEEEETMQAFVVSATLAGSMVTAFIVQRALLEAWLRAMHHEAARKTTDPERR
jgi:hypothetical protein